PKQRRPESNHLLPTKAASEAGEGLTERRILDHPMRHDLRIGFALLVRGSSRRITIVRFRPANIRVINRRICSLACLPCCPITAHAGSPRCRGKPTEKQLQPSAVDRSLHIRDGVSYPILTAASRRKTPAPTGQPPNTSLTAAERMPNTPRTTRRLLSPCRGGRLASPFGDRIRGVLHDGGFDIRANWLTRAMLAAISGGTRRRSPLCSTTG